MRWTVGYVLSTEDEITSLFGRWAKLDEVDCKLCIIHGLKCRLKEVSGQIIPSFCRFELAIKELQ